MRGTVRKISMPRRLVADLMHASIRVPFVSLARPLNIRRLLEARAQAAQPPGWAAIFVKAFALVAKERAGAAHALRQMAVAAVSTNCRAASRMVAIARVEDGEDCVLPQKIDRHPNELPLSRGRRADPARQAGAVDEVPAFRKMLRATPAAAAVAPPDLVDRPQFRTPARQLFRQFWGDLGRGLRRRRASCAQPGPVCPQLWRGEARPDHRCRDPLGSPDYRRGPDRQGP